MRIIDIVIINWNSGTQLREAVSSIARHHSWLVNSVVVVDNASTDFSLDLEGVDAPTLPFTLTVVRNRENRGFGMACNQGASTTASPFLLFLNPDACLEDGVLKTAIDFMVNPEHADVGVVGVQLVDGAGHVSRSCARFPTPTMLTLQALGLDRLPGLSFLSPHMGDWDHQSTRQVDHVIGAFYLMRRALFESVGGFDERFFVYLEDLDLSFRVARLGYRSMYLASTRAFHSGGGTSRQVKAHRLFYSVRSRLLYGFKHFTRRGAWMLTTVTLVAEPFTRSLYCLLKGDKEGLLNTWRGFAMLYRDLPNILRRACQP